MFTPYMMNRSMQATLTPSKESCSKAHSSQGSPVRKRMEELAIPGPSHVKLCNHSHHLVLEQLLNRSRRQHDWQLEEISPYKKSNRHVREG
ncbi:unnamed protein product [Acanthoscelides obtectus]|uniref:Uncharacterized protein n=1 Tax=Acanthoscelides obtectus TaxID=200917 RepID=A0A9P0L7P3_ACAOB|nr:unnamed protein product [Acanthoscelides obtectus]CAK1650214.1 hypothetical protein AOBTE_LOCUS16690 [Acanthoscelides obtectus]